MPSARDGPVVIALRWVVRGAVLWWLYPVALIETGGVVMVGNSSFLVASYVQCPVVNLLVYTGL